MHYGNDPSIVACPELKRLAKEIEAFKAPDSSRYWEASSVIWFSRTGHKRRGRPGEFVCQCKEIYDAAKSVGIDLNPIHLTWLWMDLYGRGAPSIAGAVFDRPKMLVLSQEELSDLASAVEWTSKKYPRSGAVQFKASLGRLNKKIWGVIRNRREEEREHEIIERFHHMQARNRQRRESQ